MVYANADKKVFMHEICHLGKNELKIFAMLILLYGQIDASSYRASKSLGYSVESGIMAVSAWLEVLVALRFTEASLDVQSSKGSVNGLDPAVAFF